MQLLDINEDRIGKIIRAGLLILAFAAVCLLWGGMVLDLAGIVFGGAVVSFLLAPLARLLEKKLLRPIAAAVELVGVAAALAALLTFMLTAL